jgi:hydrogenase maturation protease
MQVPGPTRCLILACGNPLRSDDGVGPWLITWAQEKFGEDPAVRIMYRQQWTPELADDIARSEAVIFIDASTQAAPGSIQVHRVAPSEDTARIATHHLQAPQLLALASQLYESTPITSLLLTIGIGSTALGETFSPPVRASLQEACELLERLVTNPHDSAIPSAPPLS